MLWELLHSFQLRVIPRAVENPMRGGCIGQRRPRLSVGPVRSECSGVWRTRTGVLPCLNTSAISKTASCCFVVSYLCGMEVGHAQIVSPLPVSVNLGLSKPNTPGNRRLGSAVVLNAVSRPCPETMSQNLKG